MSFVDVWQQMDWDDIRLSIYAKTATDVERALGKSTRDLEDFKALISFRYKDILHSVCIQKL